MDSDTVMPALSQSPLGARTTPIDRARSANQRLSQFETFELLDEIEAHVRRWVPRHAESGRQYFTLSIGFTGGQHRSVFLTEALTRRLTDLDLDRQVIHRELSSGQ